MTRISNLEQNAAATPSKKTTATKKSKDVTHTCSVDGCDAPQRAWVFCAPHYAKWRRGTLPGFVGYDGTITVEDQTIDLTDYKGKAFEVKGKEIWIENECVATV